MWDLNWHLCFSPTSFKDRTHFLFAGLDAVFFMMYCEGSSDRFVFLYIVLRGNPHWSSESSNSSAPRSDACFTQQRPSESYDANVSHFVLHTSSLISRLWSSVQFGQPDTTSQCSDTACRLALQIFPSPSFTFRHSLRHFLSVLFLSPLLRLLLSLCSLVLSPSSFTCFFPPTELSCSFFQCCKRKLVAMLISLFDALRASRASILEKPISTNRATCWRRSRLKDVSSRWTIFKHVCSVGGEKRLMKNSLSSVCVSYPGHIIYLIRKTSYGEDSVKWHGGGGTHLLLCNQRVVQ